MKITILLFFELGNQDMEEFLVSTIQTAGDLQFVNSSSLYALSVERDQKLQEQVANLEAWEVEDSTRYTKIYEYDFERSNFDSKSVLVRNTDYYVIPRDIYDWRPLEIGRDLAMKGLIIPKKIIKFPNPILLRSLGCRYQLELIMQGDATFAIFLRTTDLRNPETTALILSLSQVAQDMQQLTFMVGVFEPERRIITLIKKTEVPLFEYSTSQYSRFPMEITFTVIDNGDDKLACNICVQKNVSKSTTLVFHDIMTPIFEPTSLYILGTCASLPSQGGPGPFDYQYVKYLHISQTSRRANKDELQKDLLVSPPQCCGCTIF